MKYPAQILTCIFFLITVASGSHAQSALGETLSVVVKKRGNNYNKLTDAQGFHILQYKMAEGKDTVADLLYFEGATCIKEVSLRPVSYKAHYIDSLNHLFTPINNYSWWGKDSAYITISTRDGFLDITSFSAAYYKKIAH